MIVVDREARQKRLTSNPSVGALDRAYPDESRPEPIIPLDVGTMMRGMSSGALAGDSS